MNNTKKTLTLFEKMFTPENMRKQPEEREVGFEDLADAIKGLSDEESTDVLTALYKRHIKESE